MAEMLSNFQNPSGLVKLSVAMADLVFHLSSPAICTPVLCPEHVGPNEMKVRENRKKCHYLRKKHGGSGLGRGEEAKRAPKQTARVTRPVLSPLK